MADISTEDQIRVIQYAKNIMPLAQQEESVLMGCSQMESGVVGKQYTADQIGKWFMQPKGARHSDTPISDPRLARRTIHMTDYENAVLLDKEDSFKMLSDPMSAYSIAGRMSLARQYDLKFINALGATSYAGENGETDVAFGYNMPDSHTIDISTTKLTGVSVKMAKLYLDNQDVPDADRFFLTTPYGITGLLTEDEVTSSDYATVKALVYGQVDSWLGFKFKRTTLLDVTAANICTNYAFQKDAMSAGLASGPFTRITERDDKSFAKQLYYSLHMGAGRLEEARAVKILTLNTQTATMA